MTKQEKRATMLNMVEQWQGSGMSQAAYAKSQGITLVKFRYWIQKHRHSQDSVDFIQLGGFPSTCGVSIHYPNGIELSLPAQVPIAAIKSLINY